MIKALLFDCGGVLVAPPTGDWGLGPGYEEVLGDDFADKHLPAFRAAREKHLELLPDTMEMHSEAEEEAQFVRFYDAVLAEIGITLSQPQLERLAHVQTNLDSRYAFFGDVLPYLAKWHGQYKLGIVSDAPPSTRRTMINGGVMAHMDGATFSCDLGVLKPDARIFQSTLDQLGVAAADAIFIDDVPAKLQGALDLGMQAVQMRRPMPPRFAVAPQWEGPVVHDFAEFDAYLAGQIHERATQ